jgi:ammonium transporter, Amt family
MWKRPATAYAILFVALVACGIVLLPANWAHGVEQANATPRTVEPAATQSMTMAAEIPADRTGDAVMIMACAAFALLMTPALGLFYGGMVRRKNVLSAFQQAFILLGIVPLQWFLAGYSLSFGPDVAAGWLGGWHWFGLSGVGLEPNTELASRIPHQLLMIFEMMVAVFTAALISGAIAERMKFASYVVFILLWTTLVFDPVAHWVWGAEGWIRVMGARDFAGGLVVHLTSGLAALCAVWMLGKRKGLDTEDLHPHNLTLTALGTGILWFCWLGLNAGQARGATSAAAAAVVATIFAGAAAIVSWSAIEYFQKRKVTVLGTCTGAIAGLVAVTPAAGYVTPTGALVLGFLVCPFVYGAIVLKGKLGYDDSLDVFGVHGVGAIVGVLALGVLAAPSLTGGAGGLLNGNADLLFAQTIALAAVTVYTVVITLVLLMLVDRVMGLRLSAEDEDLGLDLTQHGQRGYMMGEGELIGVVPK